MLFLTLDWLAGIVIKKSSGTMILHTAWRKRLAEKGKEEEIKTVNMDSVPGGLVEVMSHPPTLNPPSNNMLPNLAQKQLWFSTGESAKTGLLLAGFHKSNSCERECERKVCNVKNVILLRD
ncbi:hypothetical protein CEXT_782301 [Caerostris extrusa]|uniref:Uncharacterized protein n=1 Tax=Caerostris extrusa TaxID=172846 RepID=A0AAV4PW51_CAEEX|nr:hypothetical protein CEXT_782301 [Caerostris extrusa]